ncbi:MAG: gliding motility-associated C-terminal domain-containing protein [Bacteroidota bacterium]
MSEHLAAVRHADGESWWVLSHDTNSDLFIKFLIDADGTVSRLEQAIGSALPILDQRWLSPLVFNPQGNRFALSIDTNRLELFDFDRCTGNISFFNSLDKNFAPVAPHWGISFSPNGKILYLSNAYYGPLGPIGTPTHLYQYNLDSLNLLSSEVSIYATPPPCEPWYPGPSCRRTLAGHKLGPDGRIYIRQASPGADSTVWDSLIVIRNPDVPGVGCDVRVNDIAVPPRTGFRSGFYPNIPNYRLGPLVAQVAEAGPDTSICPGSSVVLGVPDTSGTLVFTWWTGNGTDQTLSAANAAQPTATPITSTTYYLLVEDTTIDASCSTTLDSVRIDLHDTTAAPTAYVGPDTLICQGDSVTLGRPDPSGGGWLYSWTPSGRLSDANVAHPLASPQVNTTYTLEVWDTIAGQRIPCREASAEVRLEVELPLEHPSPADQPFCPGEVLTIGIPPQAGFSYGWEPPFGLQDPSASLTLVAPQEEIAYRFTVTDLSKQTENCRTRTDEVLLTTDGCVRQNVLTPNGDGINDVLFLGEYNQPVSLAIFDRWGEQIYGAGSYANDFRGGNLPDGVYYYVLKVSGEGGKEIVGNFVLLR